jgi:methyl-accepting chemotaxis protein
MIRFMSNMPIFRRMIMAFIFATLIPGMVIALLGGFFINSFQNQGLAVRTSFDAQSLASDENANLQRMNALLQAKFYQIFASESQAVTDPSLFASGGLVDGEIRALESDFDRNLPVYQNQYELATSSNMANVLSILRSNDAQNAQGIVNSQQQALNAVLGRTGWWAEYKSYQDQLANNLEKLQTDLQTAKYLSPTQLKDDYQTNYALLHQSILYFTNLRNNWQQVQQAAVDMGKAVTSVGSAQVVPIFVATAGALVLIILVIILTGYIVNQTITRPLSQLATITSRINEGKMETRAVVNGRDEISVVATAMNGMLNNIVHLMQDAQTQRDRLQARVEKLVSEVCNVGEGDLQVQAEVTSDALGVLADSFNYMVEELSSLVVRVKMMAHEVENSTTMTFQSMVQLVGNGDIQIQQIGRAAQEVQSMADVNRQVAERAQALHIIADDALLMAEAGRESVQQTLEGMGRIQTYVQDTSSKVQALGDSSREIDNIVGVISTIAQQTNRLALDAAVQAATAGENGKGFGAVAVDIRRLAERAKEQTNIITRIVRGVGDEIDAAAISMKDTERETAIGAQLAEQTGLALESIFGVVERQGNEIEVINQMANRQLQSSNSVVRIMQSVSESTQQNSTNTRGAARNMEHLARLAEQLLGSVEAFKLRENIDYSPSAHAMLPQAQERRRAMNGNVVSGSVAVSMQPVGANQPVLQSAQRRGAGSGPLGFPSLTPSGPVTPPPFQRGASGGLSNMGQGGNSQPLWNANSVPASPSNPSQPGGGQSAYPRNGGSGQASSSQPARNANNSPVSQPGNGPRNGGSGPIGPSNMSQMTGGPRSAGSSGSGPIGPANPGQRNTGSGPIGPANPGQRNAGSGPIGPSNMGQVTGGPRGAGNASSGPIGPANPGQRNAGSGPIGPANPGQRGVGSGPIGPANPGPANGGQPYPRSNGAEPVADANQDQNRQSRLRQTRLQRPSAPPEKQ